MKKYKITIANGNYPLSCTCNTIADVFECLRSIASWAPMRFIFRQQRECLDHLMENLVRMRRDEVSAIRCNGYSIDVLEEAE